MKTITILFRDKKAELTYTLTSTGINLSWVGSASNLIDSITEQERNELFMIVLNG